MKRFMNPWTLGLLAIMLFMSMRGNALGSPMDWLMSKMYILPGVIIGLSFHEFAHAFVAYKLGDSTPKLQGRVTINPMAHVDPVGLLALFFVGFGWGNPVEINPRNFNKPRRDEILVSLAGVTMNLILAIVFTIILKILATTTPVYTGGMTASLAKIIIYIIQINLVLMIFNLLPIPPLDGFNLITEIFNLKKYSWWYDIYDKGFIILMVLILFNFTDRILTPCVGFCMDIVSLILML